MPLIKLTEEVEEIFHRGMGSKQISCGFRSHDNTVGEKDVIF